jgi:ketosteroid isomerase-like protein
MKGEDEVKGASYLLGSLFVLATGFIFLGTACEGDPKRDSSVTFDKSKETEAVTKAINNVFGWAANKDFDLFFGTIADDSDFVSVTPYKRIKIGVDAVKQDTAFWADARFKAIRHEIRDLKIVFSRSGEVAWFYGELDDINEWDGQPANWEKVRWTGVLEKRDGNWRVVQQHFSWPKE